MTLKNLSISLIQTQGNNPFYSKFYLILEFMSMDLKKYLDTIPAGQYIDPVLLKVVMDT